MKNLVSKWRDVYDVWGNLIDIQEELSTPHDFPSLTLRPNVQQNDRPVSSSVERARKEVPLRENEKETAPTKGQKRQKRSPTPKHGRPRSSRSRKRDEKRSRRSKDSDRRSPPRRELKARKDRTDDRDVGMSRKEGDNGRTPQESDRRVSVRSSRCESNAIRKEPGNSRRNFGPIHLEEEAVSDSEPVRRSRSPEPVTPEHESNFTPDFGNDGALVFGDGILGPPGTEPVGRDLATIKREGSEPPSPPVRRRRTNWLEKHKRKLAKLQELSLIHI